MRKNTNPVVREALNKQGVVTTLQDSFDYYMLQALIYFC